MIQFFIRKSIVTICLNLSILCIGFFSIDYIANEFIPAIEIPAVAVVFPTTILEHERAVHDYISPVEKRLIASGVVEKVETTLDEDKAIMLVFYDWAIKPEECLQRTRQLVSEVPKPAEVLDPIFVLHRPTMSPIYREVFYGSSAGEMTESIGKTVSALERAAGVAEVRLVGAVPKIGFIDVDIKKATEHKASIKNLLSSASQTWSFRYLLNQEEASILDYVRINLENPQDINSLYLLNEDKKALPVQWISYAREGKDQPSVLYGTGQDAVILEVVKAPGADALSIVKNVKTEIEKLKTSSGLKSTMLYDEAKKIREAQFGVLQNFAIGVFLNSIILIIFLGSIVGAVVASCVFPTALLGTFFIMKTMDVSLNIFALNGFSLASGMITDSSIVVLEAIMRRYQRGQELFSSCWKGTQDVMLGVLAATLTTAAVIVPICMQTGVSSKLFSDLGITLVSTQFICLIAVFSLVPWLCSKILNNDKQQPAPIAYLFSKSSIIVNWMSNLSQKALKASPEDFRLRFGLPVGVTVLSVLMIYFMPNSEFLPAVGSQLYSLSVPVKRIQLGSQAADLRKKVAQTIGKDEGVEWVVTSNETDTLKAMFLVKPHASVPKIVQRVSESLEVELKRVQATPLGPTPNSEPLGFDGYYYISKEIPADVRSKLREKFCQSAGLVDCLGQDQYTEANLVLKGLPLNLYRASTNFLETTANVAAYAKRLDLGSLANLPLSTALYLRMPNAESLSAMPFRVGKNKEAVMSLGSLFAERWQAGESVSFRKNNQDFEPLYFRFKGITLGQARNAMGAAMEDLGISKDYVNPMGTIETMDETFDKMIGALILSAFLIFAVLVVQFRSVVQAGLIMYSIPLALGGAILGLMIMGETVNVGVIVGFILLIGIIVNNGILLMDAINQRREMGMALMEAIIDAVDSRTRPILMTTCSTVFGMMPTLLLEAEGKELYRGMAIVNVFGMSFGTFLTLILMPIVIRSAMAWGAKREVAPIDNYPWLKKARTGTSDLD
jgi:HAE1 family hydrophobic/amphiphilic exporter-1